MLLLTVFLRFFQSSICVGISINTNIIALKPNIIELFLQREKDGGKAGQELLLINETPAFDRISSHI